MGKAAYCIQMLQLLSSGRVYKCSELADLLGTTPRSVIEYKKELAEVGYHITSITGKYGGYKLDTNTTIPCIKMTDEEKAALSEGSGYLLSRNDFINKKDYQLAMGKIYSSIDNTYSQVDPSIINRFPLVMTEEEIGRRYKALDECAKLKIKIEIKYLSLKNEETVRVIHPYKLFMYNNAWFVLGFDENRKEIRYFKINRIQEFKQLIREKFRIPVYYNESDYLDEYGMKQNGDWYKIKLRLTGPYAMLVRERIYGRNQTVECIDQNTTILTCEMQNKENIKVFVLGFADNCEIIEPQWLKEELRRVANNLLSINKEEAKYEKN